MCILDRRFDALYHGFCNIVTIRYEDSIAILLQRKADSPLLLFVTEP